MENNTIKGKKIYLRKLNISDASEVYCRWLNDSEVNKYLETRKATIEELKNYIKQKNKKINCRLFGIFDINNDKHIGNIKLEPIDFFEKKAKLGIMIGEKSYRNKGIGTEATKLLNDFAFNQLKLNCIYLGVIPENKSAIRIYEKVGFEIKEINPKVIDHNGVMYDEIVMEIKKGG